MVEILISDLESIPPDPMIYRVTPFSDVYAYLLHSPARGVG